MEKLHPATLLTRSLIRCPSVTPQEGGALDLLEGVLAKAGFRCTRIRRGGIDNLYARYGEGAPVFGFNGHTDVVPVGEGWRMEPFGGEIRDGRIYGRGSADMKSGVAAFVTAALSFIRHTPDFPGSIAIAITGDEEGDAEHGTVAILDWMRHNGEQMDVCVVGEPTCPKALGDMLKIGRRGSLTADFTARGVQGHAAYPHLAVNPIAPLARLMTWLANWELDEGSEHFDPSTATVTTFDVGNPVNNVIPAEARAQVNIRFNDLHNALSLQRQIEARMQVAFEKTDATCTAAFRVSGESFLTPPGPLSELLLAAVRDVTGRTPELSTSGGTSDARFIREHCPVVEFGLVGTTMHKADEHVAIADIEALTGIYQNALRRYF